VTVNWFSVEILNGSGKRTYYNPDKGFFQAVVSS
jgi:hypothetical protein